MTVDPFSQPVNPVNRQLSPEQEAQRRAILEIRNQLNQKILAIFNSPEGDALLDMWDDIYVRQAVIIEGAPPEANAAREGRNAFIRTIRAVVNRARGENK